MLRLYVSNNTHHVSNNTHTNLTDYCFLVSWLMLHQACFEKLFHPIASVLCCFEIDPYVFILMMLKRNKFRESNSNVFSTEIAYI